MSAADLFKDPFDVEFRLKGTWIMVGRNPYFVKSISAPTVNVKDAFLNMIDLKDDDYSVPLSKLPLSSMYACPHGYYEGTFYARGPARHRYQGITSQSFWAIMPNGYIEPCGLNSCKRILKELSVQPRTRRPGKRPSGILTRDVMIDSGMNVYVRGRLRAKYTEKNIVTPVSEISPVTEQFLKNAKLSLSGSFEEFPVEEFPMMENPCSEILIEPVQPDTTVWVQPDTTVWGWDPSDLPTETVNATEF